MDKQINVSIPNVYLSDLEKIVKKVKDITGKEDVEISFEFIIATLFPTSWKNIQADLNQQYTRGYIQGRLDKEQEMKQHMRINNDLDCYCE